VTRNSYDDLGAAVEAMEGHVNRVLAEGGLEGVKMLRDFEPGQRVAARIEISTGGWLRSRDAGIDVMGDGRMVGFAGGVRRRELEPAPGETMFDAIRRALAGGS